MNNKPQPNERERAISALDLRRDGLPYREIADRLGYSDESGARKAVSRLLDRTEAEGVGELRRLESERLDAIMSAHWPAAIGGDVDASRIVLGVVDRRAKLLGLNAPAAVTVGVEPIGEREFAEAAVELIAALRPDMAAALTGTLPGAARSAVPEANETRETASPASVAHSAGNDDEEPWADVDGPTEPVARQDNTDTDGVVEPEPEPAPVIPPAGRPDLARRATQPYRPPVALGGFSQRLGGSRPVTVVHSQP